eukprot:Phypoly_transcript_17394.p1 GENE.Phypoly_transcript_17394~~Phypoly_transcript_17394.p1  ORF type:complete len:127 (+),score=18.80 Phypoly_transcript_17394:148-528(+)
MLRFYPFKYSHAEGSWIPQTDIRENGKEYVIQLEVPGCKKESVNVDIDGRRLVVKGEKPFATKEGESVYVSERAYGKFSRVFTLPSSVDPDAITANVEDGVLEIHVPKSAKSQAKSINITNLKSKL